MRLLAISSFLLSMGANAAVSPSARWVEKRSLAQIYDAALAEGGVVTVWHGGDEPNQMDGLKAAFEDAFPGITLNLTIDLSKYHDGNIDKQLAQKNVFVDSVILQTLHDFPRWKEQGALLNYAPVGFDRVFPSLKDRDATYYGYIGLGWQLVWNAEKLPGNPIRDFTDFLRPELKDKIVLAYPNDDDAILFAFDLIIKQYGEKWFEDLLSQNPRWVRGSATPAAIIADPQSRYAASFTTMLGLGEAPSPFNVTFPRQGRHVTWAQTAAILKDAPHPEGAKLFHNFLLSRDFQAANGFWSVRSDVPAPACQRNLISLPRSNPVEFRDFMADRASVERLRFLFEDRIGTAQGLTPLGDDL